MTFICQVTCVGAEAGAGLKILKSVPDPKYKFTHVLRALSGSSSSASAILFEFKRFAIYLIIKFVLFDEEHGSGLWAWIFVAKNRFCTHIEREHWLPCRLPIDDES